MGEFDDAFNVSLSEVEAVRSMDDLRTFVTRLLQRYDLRHAVYHAVALPTRAEANPVAVFTYPEQWAQHYIEKNYFAVDPVVGAAATNLLPFDWSRLDRRGPRAKQLFGEANEFGIGRQGLTFPIRGPTGDHALFTVTSDLKPNEWEKLRKLYMRDFQLLAHFVHGKVLEFEHGITFPVKQLSSREREVLSWAARGLQNDAIAHKLGLSESAVRAYFASARHKLNCVSRSHVLAVAVSLRLIGPASGNG